MKIHLLILLAAAALMTTGCAELSAIRQAAVSELNSDVISEETAIYRGNRGGAAVMIASHDGTERRKAGSLLEIAMLGEKSSHRGMKGKWER